MSLNDNMAQVIETTRLRILHALEVFPFISGSMLHQAIGTATATQLWKPILDQLIEEGLVKETNLQAKSPTGRAQSYTIYHLADRVYTYSPK